MGRTRPVFRLIAWVVAVSLAVAGSGCATTAGTGASSPSAGVATATLAATPTPHPIAAYTCAAGSLPVRPEVTRTSCSVSTERGAPVLRAAYAGSAGSGPSVDEYALRTTGWKIADAEHGDGAVTSQGYGVYIYESAYFAFQWTASSDSSLLTIQTSVPPNDPPVPCGQAPTAGSALLKGVVLPAGSFLLLDGSMALTPACAADVQSFYEAWLPAAGWHEELPFIPVSQDPSATQLKRAVFTRGTVRATITTAGYPGTQTFILVGTTS